ncbi:hypothetical protein [Bradyrhizobium sp. WSM1743]|uniref:hypothetical protein n=1 Tax=Bradyrhizobium sp. WSM1743 TaxID=318996 RepID=UPI0012ECA3AC|nr:hypothetical protein [Bradyrhizobium sp. WSM1743]
MLLALAVACMVPLRLAQAADCPAKPMLTIKDSQDGFAGKTGTIWTIKPDCSFEVARFHGENVSAPHAKGQLTPEQQSRLAAVLSTEDVATLPAHTGQPAPVNSRQISIEYGGKTAVLDLGTSDPAALGNLPESGRRVMEISKAVKGVTGE